MQVFIAKAEHPEKYNWWLNELDSLGISTLRKNGLNNHKEASDLTEVVIQTLSIILLLIIQILISYKELYCCVDYRVCL